MSYRTRSVGFLATSFFRVDASRALAVVLKLSVFLTQFAWRCIVDVIIALFVWTLFGIFVGALARLLVPGRQPMGFLGTMLLGVVGSFAGGLLVYAFRGGDLLQPSGFLMSLLGAVVVLLIATSARSRRARI